MYARTCSREMKINAAGVHLTVMLNLHYLSMTVYQVSSWIPLLTTSTVASFKFRPECGRQFVRKSKIVNGQDAYRGEFPWMVSLQDKKGHFCGGTLIDDQWVLTAAHCFKGVRRNQDVSSYRVVINMYSLSEAVDSEGTIGSRVTKIISHDQFSATEAINDIALVKLAQPVQWDAYIQPACLPESNSHKNIEGENVIVTGWGWTKEPSFGGEMSDKLQKVVLKVLKKSDCAMWYQEAGYPNNVKDGQLCAGYKAGGKDSCLGDSGGPVLRKNGDRFDLVGIVSWGIGCARPLLPGLYTEVTTYLPWIKSHINNPFE